MSKGKKKARLERRRGYAQHRRMQSSQDPNRNPSHEKAIESAFFFFSFLSHALEPARSNHDPDLAGTLAPAESIVDAPAPSVAHVGQLHAPGTALDHDLGRLDHLAFLPLPLCMLAAGRDGRGGGLLDGLSALQTSRQPGTHASLQRLRLLHLEGLVVVHALIGPTVGQAAQQSNASRVRARALRRRSARPRTCRRRRLPRFPQGPERDLPAAGVGQRLGEAFDDAALEEVEQAVEDGELHLELDAVHGRLVRDLQDVQTRVLEREQGDVEHDDGDVDPDEVLHDLVPCPARLALGADQRPCAPEVDGADDDLLQEEDADLDLLVDGVGRDEALGMLAVGPVDQRCDGQVSDDGVDTNHDEHPFAACDGTACNQVEAGIEHQTLARHHGWPSDHDQRGDHHGRRGVEEELGDKSHAIWNDAPGRDK